MALSSSSSAIKVPKPQYYTGTGPDRTKTKLLDWTDSIEAYIIASNGTLAKDGITVASCYLTDTAKTWFRAWKDKHTDETTGTRPTYTELITAMKANFIPSTSDDILYHKWERISQIKDGKTRAITVVAAELLDLALQLPDMSDFVRKQRLYAAMIPELRARVEPTVKDTDSWETIIALAEKHDSAMFQARRQDNQRTNKKSFNRNKGFQKPFQPGFQNNGKGKAPRNRPPQKTHTPHPKLTDELRAQLTRENKCFFCREPGHSLAQCTKRPKNPRYTDRKTTVSSSATEISSAAITLQTPRNAHTNRCWNGPPAKNNR
jgi:hypothetical protein